MVEAARAARARPGAPGRQHRAGRRIGAPGGRGRGVAAAPRRGRSTSTPMRASSPPAPAPPSRRCAAAAAARAGPTASTGRPATRPRSAGRSPPTPAGSGWCATGRHAAQLLGVDAVLGTTGPASTTWAGSRRTPPATTCPACCAAARAPWASSPPPACAWCRRSPSGPWPRWRSGRWKRRGRAVGELRRALPGLEAAEAYGAARGRPGGRPPRGAGRPPPDAGATLLVEVGGAGDQVAVLADAVEGARRGPRRRGGRATAPGGRRCGGTASR